MFYILKPFQLFLGENVIRNVSALLPKLERVEPYFEGHLRRACFYAFHFAKKAGLSEQEARLLYLATFFHDIGKIQIPSEILNKCGPLKAEEFKVIEGHPHWGAKLCREMGLPEEIASLVESHHEKLDGTGYPGKLKAGAISPLARILATIEIYDALRSERCYKEPFSLDHSLQILFSQAEAGKLDGGIVRDFARFVEELPIDPDGISADVFSDGLGVGKASFSTCAPEPMPDGSGSLTVLIVEDNNDLRELNQIALRKNGYRVTEASNAAEAFQRLKSEPVDIILLDVMLPDMDGFELCKKVREDPAYDRVRVIFLSALSQSEDKVRGFEAGGNDYIAKPFFYPELLARVRTEEELIRQRRELERLVNRDPLTGLYNRRYFIEKLEGEFERATRYDRPLSVLMADIDDFKSVNDNHGHDAGDFVLKKIAGVLKAKTRKTDIQVRYGGEEFIVLLPEINLDGAIQAGIKLRHEIKKLVFDAFSTVFSITLSIGVASYLEKRYLTSEEMLKDADRALYTAKRNGKDCVRTPLDYERD